MSRPLIAPPALAAVVLAIACSSSPTAPTAGPTMSAFVQLTERFETAHFVLHHAPGDSVDAERCEAHLQWLSAYLGVALPAKVDYYKFREWEDYWAAVSPGTSLGMAQPGGPAVFTIQPFHAHEVVHLFTGQLGSPNSFFHEGMSNAFQNDPLAGDYEGRDHWSGLTFHDLARQARAAGTLPRLETIIDTDGFRSTPGAARPAGSFVRYLVDTQGVGRMKQTCAAVGWSDSRETVADTLLAIYGESLPELERAWLAFLDAGR